MSTATATDLTVPLIGGRNHFLIRRLHSLTGLVFGGYIVIHLLVNATLIQGRGELPSGATVFQLQVDKIHSLPFLFVLEWALIYLPIIFHTLYGLWIILTGQPNVNRYAYAKNYFYVAQRVSAIIIAAFIVFHVLSLKGVFGSALAFSVNDATGSIVHHLQWPFLRYFVYPIGILASCYHLANGVWTAAITWGLTVSAGAQRRWGYVCAVLFAVTLVCGMLALAGAIGGGGIAAH